jgi:hypothetical protein
VKACCLASGFYPTLFSILNVNPYKINHFAHKEIPACRLHTRGGIFCWGPIFYIWWPEVLPPCSIKQCENLLLIPKTWETDNNAYPNTHLQHHPHTSLPPKGAKKKKRKKSWIYWVHAAISHLFESNFYSERCSSHHLYMAKTNGRGVNCGDGVHKGPTSNWELKTTHGIFFLIFWLPSFMGDRQQEQEEGG